MSSDQFKGWCLCGASWQARATGRADLIAAVRESFLSVHSGDGHGEATARQASAARAKALRAEMRRGEEEHVR